MSPGTDPKSKKIKIYITTYPNIGSKYIKPKETEVKMCDQSCMTTHKDRKFICTLCLNEQLDGNDSKDNNTKARLKNNTCPFCHKESKTCTQDASTDTDKKVMSHKNNYCNSDIKCLTRTATETGTYTEPEKNTDKKNANRHDGFNKLLKISVADCCCCSPAEFCCKHGTIGESSAKIRQINTEKDRKGTEKPITTEELIQRGKTNLKSTKPCNGAICKAVGSGKILKDDDTREKNFSTKYEDSADEDKKVVETQTCKNPMDIKTGLSLLNEVLTVFQNQKQGLNCKDASIQVADINKKMRSLSKSKIIKYSIREEEISRDDSKFVILECRHPDCANRSKTSLHLTKHKSSSIPQMKLEELKHAIKEKTKSKDTVDEVNRMFAIVGKYEKQSKDDLNRPMIRSGPRILPVVKTPGDHPKNTKELKDNSSDSSARQRQLEVMKTFKICQTNDYMSRGDSMESCSKCVEDNKTDKCVYMLSCRHNVQAGLRHCECCMKRNPGCRCQEHVTVEESDSSTNF